VWRAHEFYFFRVKPLPGTNIIDILGQQRTNRESRMHFASEDQIMVNVKNERILTFDQKGYIINKEFSMYDAPIKI
jgi:hypothetical protein